eukprot:319174-Pleurochrysis_carterae.AAC.2
MITPTLQLLAPARRIEHGACARDGRVAEHRRRRHRRSQRDTPRELACAMAATLGARRAHESEEESARVLRCQLKTAEACMKHVHRRLCLSAADSATATAAQHEAVNTACSLRLELMRVNKQFRECRVECQQREEALVHELEEARSLLSAARRTEQLQQMQIEYLSLQVQELKKNAQLQETSNVMSEAYQKAMLASESRALHAMRDVEERAAAAATAANEREQALRAKITKVRADVIRCVQVTHVRCTWIKGDSRVEAAVRYDQYELEAVAVDGCQAHLL